MAEQIDFETLSLTWPWPWPWMTLKVILLWMSHRT